MGTGLQVAAIAYLLVGYACVTARLNWGWRSFAAWSLYVILTELPLLRGVLFPYRWPVAIITGVWGVTVFLASRRARLCPRHRVGLLLTGLGLFSATYSVMPTYSFLRGGGLGLLFGFAFFGVGSLVNGPSDVVTFMKVRLVSLDARFAMVAAAALGGSFVFGLEGRFGGYGHMKATGVSAFCTAALPFYIWRSRWPGTPGWLRKVSVAQVLVLYVFVLASRTRTGMIAAILVTAFMLFVVYPKCRKLVPIGVAAILPLVFMLPSYLEKHGNVSLFLRLGQRTRLDRWQVVLRSERLTVGGRGLGTSSYYALTGLQGAVDWRHSTQVYVHSQHIAVAYELGVVGLVVFWWLLGGATIKGLQGALVAADRGHLELAMLFASFLTKLVDTLSHDGFMSVGNVGIAGFWILVALMWKATQLSRMPQPCVRWERSPAGIRPLLRPARAAEVAVRRDGQAALSPALRDGSGARNGSS